MADAERRLFEFGPFRLDPQERTLLREAEAIPLPPKLFDVLLVLVERSGRLVKKEELLRLVWKDAFVEEGSLTRSISRLRLMLGDGANGHRFIETVSKAGYRFVASVECAAARESLLVPGKEPLSLPPSPVAADALKTPQQHRRWRGLLVSAAALVLLTTGSLLLMAARRHEAASTRVRSLAVLPFQSDPSHSHSDFALEVSDELTTKLGGLERLAVRPAGSVERVEKSESDPIRIGKNLGVDWMLDGTIQSSGDRARLWVRLTDTLNGRVLWSARYDEPLDDPIAAVNATTAGLASALAPQLSARDREVLARPETEDLDAYQLYMKGRLDYIRRGQSTLAAIETFQKAIRKDPRYSLAYAGLADSYSVLFDFHVLSSAEAAPNARINALKAVQLGDTLAETHLSLAWVRAWFDWDWAAAERELQRAGELRPNDPEVFFRKGIFESGLGRFDEALRELRRAQQLDPVSPLVATVIGKTLRRSKQFDLAVEELRKAEAMDSNFGPPIYNLGEAYEEQGMYEAAVGEFLKSMKAFGTQETERAVRQGYEQGGPMGAYRAWLQRLEGDGSMNAVRVAQIYEVLGQPDRALETLERGCDERAADLFVIGAEPSFENLRREPRFQKLLRRMNLPPSGSPS